MLGVPYLLQPYPDEILGSWLARLKLHNGKSVWQKLTTDAGFPSKIATSFFDVPTYSTHIQNLFNTLGTNYERVLHEMTTLPYWLVFDRGSSNEGFLKGTESTPNISYFIGTRIFKALQLSGISTRGAKPKYCTHCLQEDYKRYGEPYWHRSHQLPNVFFCSRHSCLLDNSCRLCTAGTPAIVYQLIGLPKVQCLCGHELIKDKNFQDPFNPYAKLAKISAQALNHTSNDWDHGHVKIFFQELINRKPTRKEIAFKRYGTTIKKILSPCFSPFDQKYSREIGTFTHDVTGLLAGREGPLNSIRAPDCCALLVAKNVSLDEAIREIKKISSKLHSLPTTNYHTNPSSSELALKKISEHRHKSNNKNLKYSNAFWLLRIKNPGLISTHFPEIKLPPLPTIDSDREIIFNLYKKRKSDQIKKTNSAESNAFKRAKIRDNIWLMSVLPKKKESITRFSKAKTSLKVAQLIKIIDELEKINDSDSRPRRLTPLSLCRQSGISLAQVRKLIRINPLLSDKISATNKDLHLKKIRWALKKLRTESRKISMSGVRELASVFSNQVSDQELQILVDKSTSACSCVVQPLIHQGSGPITLPHSQQLPEVVRFGLKPEIGC
ncbi:TniQ family protein [Variovorax sp. HJSM1_2]|uniref:TniQ family protein n=1 Tax=Variovorax sp. HJSM1_2 TaxID=3366263 RepID=UPI003BDDD1A6